MIIDCISDLHGYKPQMPGGDLLIVAGDLTAQDKPDEYFEFFEWFTIQDYKHKVFIAGNHDCYLENTRFVEYSDRFHYLCDSGINIEGFKIWGSPWTRRFSGQNPDCMAFSLLTEFQLNEKFNLIPKDTDILITHTPVFGVLDSCSNGRCGSDALWNALDFVKPKLHVFGHIHECGGQKQEIMMEQGQLMISVNACHVNRYYKDVNPPTRIIL